MTPILLFVFYLLGFSYWLYRWGKKSLPDNRWLQRILLPAFFFRVAVGLFFAYYTRKLPGNDYWRLFGQSGEETGWLLHDTPRFFYRDILDNNGYQGSPFKSFFYKNGDNFYFNDLKDNLIIKFNAILNVFSGCNYYVNVLIASFLVIVSLLGLAKVLGYWLRPASRWTVFAVLLLYPPLVLWTSNIQKDLFSLILVSVILFTYGFRKQKMGWVRFLYGSICFSAVMLLLLMKNYMAMILVGCLWMKWLAKPALPRFPQRFLLLAGSCFLLFYVSSFFPSSLDFPLLLARKQHGFYEIAGAQPIPSIALSGSVGSYLQNLPNAVMNCFFFPLSRGLLGERVGWIGLLTCLFSLLLTFCAVRFPAKNGICKNPFFLTVSAFCLFNYLLIGESVAYYGALLRYRSIPETFFCVLLLQCIDFDKIKLLCINKKII